MPERPRAVAFDVLQTHSFPEPCVPVYRRRGRSPRRWNCGSPKRCATASRWPPPIRTAALEVASATRRSCFPTRGSRPIPPRSTASCRGSPSRRRSPTCRRRSGFEQGARILALTNGSSDTTRAALRKAGLEHHVEQVLSIEDVKRWKPRREVYLHAAQVAGVRPGRPALWPRHAWDVHGAKRAGLIAGWVRRQEGRFSRPWSRPTCAARPSWKSATRCWPCREADRPGKP